MLDKIGSEEPKQETLNVKQNTHYVDFSNPNADKLSSASTTSMKQETIEEAACKALGYEYNYWLSMHSKDQSTLIYKEVTNWCKGAKWQQERSYSEEDLIDFAHFYFTEEFNSSMQTSKSTKDIFNEWFEQFKK
jgi:hypothetical protein